MQGRDMVVVIIRPPTMAAPCVKLADIQGNFASVVLRVEDRDAVCGNGDAAPQETPANGRRFFGRNWNERKTPGVGAGVVLRQGHLLLPGRDADHPIMCGQAIALDVEEALIRTGLHGRGEKGEGSSLGGGCVCCG